MLLAPAGSLATSEGAGGASIVSGPRPTGWLPSRPTNEMLDPRYRRELKQAKRLVERLASIAIAARQSPKRATTIVENPADRSIRGRALWRVGVASRIVVSYLCEPAGRQTLNRGDSQRVLCA